MSKFQLLTECSHVFYFTSGRINLREEFIVDINWVFLKLNLLRGLFVFGYLRLNLLCWLLFGLGHDYGIRFLDSH